MKAGQTQKATVYDSTDRKCPDRQIQRWKVHWWMPRAGKDWGPLTGMEVLFGGMRMFVIDCGHSYATSCIF